MCALKETRFIVVGRFIDGSGADVQRNVFLKVEDGIITTIGAAEELSKGDDLIFDDLSHCTILPGLVDCSVTLSRSPSVDSKAMLSFEGLGSFAKKTALYKQHIFDCHAHGVLGVADNTDIRDYVGLNQLKPEVENIITIRSAGRICKIASGCNDEAIESSDFIKICYTGNIEEDEALSPHLQYDVLRQILKRKNGRKAVVVANGPQHVSEAIEAGCDAIEQGYDMGEDNIRAMARKNILWIPNVLRAKNALDGSSSGGSVCCRFSMRYVAPGKPVPGAEAIWQKVLAQQLQLLKLARKLGVTTAVGTGSGSVGLLHGESMVEEMKLFIKAGYSQEETIRCASENGARFFGMERLGALTVGKRATFLMARGTVKQLPRKLAYLEGVYINGGPSRAYRKNPIKQPAKLS